MRPESLGSGKNCLENVKSGLHRSPALFYPQAPQASEKKIFKQILSACQMVQLHQSNAETTGLKAADYLANPLPRSLTTKLSTVFASHGQLKIPIGKTKSKAQPTQSEKEAVGRDPAVDPRAGKDQTGKSIAMKSPQQLAPQEVIEDSVHKAAAKYRLAPELIAAVIKAESNFEVNAVSKAGAQGLMQLMPATAAELGVKDPFDITQNIDGGALYLRKMLDRYDGDVSLALAAYNAGPGTVEKYDGNIPPYPETKDYIQRVLKFCGRSA